MQPTFIRQVSDYVVRQCDRRDLPQVIRINLDTLPEHYSDMFFEELLLESPETFLVAEKNGTIVGYIMCRVEFGFSHLKRFGLARKCHIVSVAVSEGHRNRGLGRALAEEAVKGMQNKGCSEVYLEVRLTNELAIRLYEQLGFKATARLEGYYRDGEAAFLMSKRIE